MLHFSSSSQCIPSTPCVIKLLQFFVSEKCTNFIYSTAIFNSYIILDKKGNRKQQ